MSDPASYALLSVTSPSVVAMDAPGSGSPRFLTLDDVAGELAMSRSQVYALVRRQELVAVKIGGRGQWRVERAQLEDYIQRLYRETRTWIEQHPFTGEDDEPSG